MTVQILTRRSALTGAAIAAVAAVAGFVVARNSSAAQAKPGTAAANGYGPSTSGGSGAGGGGTRLATLDQIPVGGGLILDKADIVLVRATAGDVVAFSATCTHQGCQVASVAKNTISCPCHGSEFNASTGAVVNGPASRPLPKVTVVVRDGAVFTS